MSTVKPQLDLKIYLQEELLRRCRANPRYSLRAFAKALDIESSALSKMLHGKRAITPQSIAKFTARLGLPPLELESALSAQTTYKPISLDQFSVIADWYHFAILELTQTKQFKSDVRWISKKLGISLAESTMAIERLKRLGYLSESKSGQWIDTSGNVTTTQSEFSTAALRRLQRQILQKAMEALEEVPFENRHQSAMTMAIDSKNLKVAQKEIRMFRRRLEKKLKGKSQDSVFQLSVSLFPLTKLSSKENKS